MKPQTCTYPGCGQEVRWGWRNGVETWWHREAVDHNPMFGRTSHTIDWAAVEAQRKHHRDHEETTTATRDIPDPEVLATPVEREDPRVPQGARNVIKWAREAGWTATATYSRGPRVHASHGTLLGISDYIQVRLRLDGTPRAAVASWEDGKFQFAYLIDTDTHTAERAQSGALKAWIKGEIT